MVRFKKNQISLKLENLDRLTKFGTKYNLVLVHSSIKFQREYSKSAKVRQFKANFQKIQNLK